MRKLSEGVLPDAMRAEYCDLIRRIGARYKSRHVANHSGLTETAQALGIAYPTLKARLRAPDDPNASKWITTEQLLAARWLYDNPHAGNPIETIPEPPRMPETMRQRIAAIIHDSSRPLNATEVTWSLNTHYGAKTTRATVQSRLGEMCKEEIPLIERVGRDLYRGSEFNRGENV